MELAAREGKPLFIVAVVDKDGTTIIEGAGDAESIKARCDHLRKQVEDAESRLS